MLIKMWMFYIEWIAIWLAVTLHFIWNTRKKSVSKYYSGIDLLKAYFLYSDVFCVLMPILELLKNIWSKASAKMENEYLEPFLAQCGSAVISKHGVSGLILLRMECASVVELGVVESHEQNCIIVMHSRTTYWSIKNEKLKKNKLIFHHSLRNTALGCKLCFLISTRTL